MRVLFLTDQFPYPLHDGGNLRTFHVLAGLAQEHEVTMIAHEPPRPSAVSTFPIACRVVTVQKQRLPSRIAGGLMQGSRLQYSMFLTKNWSSRLLLRAEIELKRSRFDAIHFNHLDTACFVLKRNWPQRKIFDTHNCLSDLARQTAQEISSWSRRQVFEFEAKRLHAAELAICRRMDLNLVCSDVDAQAYRRLCPSGHYEVIPNGVDTQYFQPDTTILGEANSLVFTGAMNYYPNEQASLFFCQQILPRIQAPKAQVILVGRHPTLQVRALHDGCRVVVTGGVNDVRPFVHRGQVFVVPLLHGSGTRLKILEAFAMGKAVVSTSIGAAGLPVTDGRELILADTPEHFAKSIDDLLADPARRNALGRAARDFVVTRFDWGSIQGEMRDRYRIVMGTYDSDAPRGLQTRI
ncbi:MAG: glycosyltransferase [Pirellula staleyi]